MNKLQKGTMCGLLIGDSHLRRINNSAKLEMRHSEKQKEYLYFKTELVSVWLGKDIKIHPINNSGYPAFYSSVMDKSLVIFHNWIYKNGVKFITEEYLHRVSDLGVAIWYMDDGSLIHKKNGKGWELVFSTYCSEVEAVNCINFFKKRYDCDFTKKKNKRLFSVRCGKKSAEKLLSVLNKHIVPCMQYKTFLNTPST